MAVSRLLLTGATGFIGGHVLDQAVARGWDVVACGRGERPVDLSSSVRWLAADLRDPASAYALGRDAEAGMVLHLAWNAVPGQYWTAGDNVDWLHGSLALVRGFIDSGGQRFVGVGSCAEYDWQDPVCDEKTSGLAPATLYGVCKDATRRVAERLCADAGTSFAWARQFFLYGPRETAGRLVSATICKLLSGQPASCSDGQQIRDYLDVRDVAAALLALTASPVQGAVNIGSGTGTRIADIVGEIAKAVGRPQLLRMGALPRRPDEPESLVAATHRLNQEVGWRPSIDLRQGIEESVQWWRSKLEPS